MKWVLVKPFRLYHSYFIKKKNVKNTKSLIVTPTSLIYNWKSEFENFAPDIKVLLIHGNKKRKGKIIKYY